MSETSIRISRETYNRLLKLKAQLTIRNSEAKTFDDVINELLDFYEKYKEG